MAELIKDVRFDSEQSSLVVDTLRRAIDKFTLSKGQRCFARCEAPLSFCLAARKEKEYGKIKESNEAVKSTQ